MSRIETYKPNVYRLTNNPLTMSCICMDLATQSVLRTKRVLRVRKAELREIVIRCGAQNELRTGDVVRR